MKLITKLVQKHLTAMGDNTYLRGPKAYMNIKADEVDLSGDRYIAWLGYPIKANDSILVSDYYLSGFDIVMFFAVKTHLDNNQEQEENLIDPMFVKARQFILKLKADKDYVKYVVNIRRIEAQKVADIGLSGCFLYASIIPWDDSTTCVS